MTKVPALIVLLLLQAAPAPAREGQIAVTSRRFEVSAQRLLSLLGGKASQSAAVFALPLEQLENLARSSDSGVRLEQTTVSVQGLRGRVDGLGSTKANYALVDLGKGTIELAQPDRKTYLSWTRPEFDATTPLPRLELRDLNRFQSINGFPARAYSTGSAGEEALVWVTEEQPEAARVYRRVLDLQMSMGGNAALADIAVAQASEKGLPVRLQVLGAAGYAVREITAVKNTDLPPAFFELPGDFQRADQGGASGHRP